MSQACDICQNLEIEVIQYHIEFKATFMKYWKKPFRESSWFVE